MNSADTEDTKAMEESSIADSEAQFLDKLKSVVAEIGFRNISNVSRHRNFSSLPDKVLKDIPISRPTCLEYIKKYKDIFQTDRGNVWLRRINNEEAKDDLLSEVSHTYHGKIGYLSKKNEIGFVQFTNEGTKFAYFDFSVFENISGFPIDINQIVTADVVMRGDPRWPKYDCTKVCSKTRENHIRREEMMQRKTERKEARKAQKKDEKKKVLADVSNADTLSQMGPSTSTSERWVRDNDTTSDDKINKKGKKRKEDKIKKKPIKEMKKLKNADDVIASLKDNLDAKKEFVNDKEKICMSCTWKLQPEVSIGTISGLYGNHGFIKPVLWESLIQYYFNESALQNGLEFSDLSVGKTVNFAVTTVNGAKLKYRVTKVWCGEENCDTIEESFVETA